jgi:uncharacterized membrane protein YedE/YeeE
VDANSYYRQYLYEKPLFDWQQALVLFLAVGALVAGSLSKSHRRETIPLTWEQCFGKSRLKRNAAAFLGGVLVLFGARLADGCTSGNSISGGMLLALSAWGFTAALFAGGIVTAFILYRRIV